jgi:hypothetical protein
MTHLAPRISAALALLTSFLPPMAQERAGDKALVIIDLRPREEREGDGLTPLTGACNEDVYRIADAASNPLKVAVLKSDLNEQLGSAGGGKTLTVLNWTVYYNKQREGGQPWAKIVPVGGIPLPGKDQGKLPGSKCTRQESAGGWFDPSEVTGKHSPLISVFEGTYAGTPVGVRIVHSPRRKIEGKFKGGTHDSQAVLDAVHETAKALGAILPR